MQGQLDIQLGIEDFDWEFLLSASDPDILRSYISEELRDKLYYLYSNSHRFNVSNTGKNRGLPFKTAPFLINWTYSNNALSI